MKKHMFRLAALLLAMIMAVTACGLAESEDEDEDDDTLPETVDYTVAEAEGEEDSDAVFTVEPGTYEWYMLPADMEDGHAYLNVVPAAETVYMENVAWTYTFQLEEIAGVSFYPYSVTIISFCDGTELTRTTVTEEEHDDWWTGEIPAGTQVTYTGTETNDVMTAVAISVIGSDEQDYELEFHGIVFLEK